jgi:hypothetical protein
MPMPEAGTYMGRCYPPSATDLGACDPGLTCARYSEMKATSPNGGEGCGFTVCTHPCDEGCEAPSTGCSTGMPDVMMSPAGCAPTPCL